MSAMLPMWIIGAPLVLAIINRFMTPSVPHTIRASSNAPAGRASPAAASRL